MNKITTAAAIAALLAAPSLQALPGLPDIAVGATAGTAGIGGQVTVGVLPFLNARASVQGFNYSRSINSDGIDYDGKLKLLTYGAYLDVYPFLVGPRISAGLVGNGNKVDLRATCPNTCSVGDVTVTGSNALVTGNLGFRHVAPYLGLGISNPMKGLPFYVGLDAGVLFHGRPKPSLRASGTATVTDAQGNTRENVDLATDPDVQNAIATEQANVSDDIRKYKFYPVVQLSIGWRF